MLTPLVVQWLRLYFHYRGHRLDPWLKKFHSPWNSPGQNTGVGSLSFLQKVFPIQGSNPGIPHCRWIIYHLSYQGSPNKHYEVEVKVTQSCSTLCDPKDYTVHGILQARILEWIAFTFSRASSQPRNRTHVSHIAGRFFTS